MTVRTIMVFMLVIPEANIFHENNDLEPVFITDLTVTVVLCQNALKSMEPLLYKQLRTK